MVCVGVYVCVCDRDGDGDNVVVKQAQVYRTA